jgi:hypothetical protein
MEGVASETRRLSLVFFRKADSESQPPLDLPTGKGDWAFLHLHNPQPRPFVWTKTADQILNSIARLCRRTNDSGH